jgi:hypothetical protein
MILKLITITVIVLSLFSVEQPKAFEFIEHKGLADSTFKSVLREVNALILHNSISLSFGNEEVIIPDRFFDSSSFGELVAEFAIDDQKQHRFHRWSESVLNQIRRISSDELTNCLSKAMKWAKNVNSELAFPEVKSIHSDNVIGSYLIHHLAALRIAASKDLTESERLARALIWEAIAQGYLADCFSSGHMIVPVHHFISELQLKDREHADKHHSLTGFYVINAAGDVWQSFGDGALYWYRPSYQHVLEACQSSLRELLLVFYQMSNTPLPESLSNWYGTINSEIPLSDAVQFWISIQNLDSLYNTPKPPTLLPTLLYLPMPVVAAWSKQTEELTNGKFHKRKYYPQLNESNGRDTTISGIDEKFLLKRDDIPSWMIAPPFRDTLNVDPEELIKFDPLWSSVAYIQSFSPATSFEGLTIDFGMSWISSYGGVSPAVGLGYGFYDEQSIFRGLTAGLRYYPKSSSSGSDLLTVYGSIRLINPLSISILSSIETIGAEVALVSELERDGDFGLGLGINLRTKPHSFNSKHFGLSFELAYEAFTILWPTRYIHQFTARIVLN